MTFKTIVAASLLTVGAMLPDMTTVARADDDRHRHHAHRRHHHHHHARRAQQIRRAERVRERRNQQIRRAERVREQRNRRIRRAQRQFRAHNAHNSVPRDYHHHGGWIRPGHHGPWDHHDRWSHRRHDPWEHGHVRVGDLHFAW